MFDIIYIVLLPNSYYNSWIENSAPNSTAIGSDLSEDPDTYSVSQGSVKRNSDVKNIIATTNLDSSDESLSDWIDFQ